MLGRELLRALVFILGVADDGEDGPGLEGLLVQVQLLEDVPDDPLGVVGVIDRDPAVAIACLCDNRSEDYLDDGYDDEEEEYEDDYEEGTEEALEDTQEPAAAEEDGEGSDE